MKKSKLAEYLRTSRENAGLTQVEIARKLNYGNSQFISNWERGLSAPPLNTLRPLSKLYGISMDELFERILEASLEEMELSMRTQFSQLKKK